MMGVFRDQQGRTPRVIALRMERQERFFSSGAESVFVISEESLYRWHGGQRVMGRQLQHLVDMGQRADVTIRIVPFEAGSHAGVGTPFTLLRLREPEEEVLYIESVNGDQLVRDEPERIAEYEEYFEVMNGLALSEDNGNALLMERIGALRDAENPEAE
jgi:hypothetical protein